jgi:hypothetical protein
LSKSHEQEGREEIEDANNTTKSEGYAKSEVGDYYRKW